MENWNWRRTGPNVPRFAPADHIDAATLGGRVGAPTSWIAPRTVPALMTKTAQPLYERACHEGNYSMASSFSVARAREAKEAELREGSR